jgi:hypothetical protein
MKVAQKRATVYFDQQLHEVLRLKAVETDRSVSDIINEAVRQSLAEDAEDLAAFEERAREPRVPLEDVLRDMKKRGQL